MSGYAKRSYEKFIVESRKDFSKYVNTISNLLPLKITAAAIISLIKEFYPYEYQVFCERCDSFSKQERSLRSIKHKSRYSIIDPDTFIIKLRASQRLLQNDYQRDYATLYDEERVKQLRSSLHKKRDPHINRIRNKVQKAKLKTQQMEPEFLDKLIGLYDRKNTSQNDRIYIMLELEKYYTPKIVRFFQRKMNSEFNFQLRHRAFLYLQSMGHYAVLRAQKSMPFNTNNSKRKQQLREYAKMRFNIAAIPQELEYRIENNAPEQRLKHFDFFISHSSKDFELIQSIIAMLNENNKNIYCDWINDDDYLKRHLVGDATLEVIKKRIEKSDAILFVKTDHSLNSIWVKYELNYALQQGKTIFEYDDNATDKTVHKMTEYWFLDINYMKLDLFKKEHV